MLDALPVPARSSVVLGSVRPNPSPGARVPRSRHVPGREAAPYEALPARQPIGHVGQVSDVVSGILFLESSPYITGEILHIDGGQIAGH